MSTFDGAYGDVCNGCRLHVDLHEDDALTWPRVVSQPLSRVVAEPECCGAPASSLIADVAAFRALTPQQRAALLAIGANGPALLEAGEMWGLIRVFRGQAAATQDAADTLAEMFARIDARRS